MEKLDLAKIQKLDYPMHRYTYDRTNNRQTEATRWHFVVEAQPTDRLMVKEKKANKTRLEYQINLYFYLTLDSHLELLRHSCAYYLLYFFRGYVCLPSSTETECIYGQHSIAW